MGQSKELYGMTQPVSLEEQIMFAEFNKNYHNALEVQLPTCNELYEYERDDETYEYERDMKEVEHMEQMNEYWEREN